MMVSVSCLLLLFAFWPITFESPLLLQPLLLSDTSHPLTSGSPHFIIPVCLHYSHCLFLQAFSSFHCFSPASFSSFLSHFSSLLFSHLALHPSLPPPSYMANRCLNKVSVESLKSGADWWGHHRAGCAHEVSMHTHTWGSAMFCFSYPKTRAVARGEKLSLTLL